MGYFFLTLQLSLNNIYMYNHYNLKISTPVVGRWLYFPGCDLSFLYSFDITDTSYYPPDAKCCVNVEISQAIEEFKKPHSPSGFPLKPFRGYQVPDTDTIQLKRLHKIVSLLRDAVAAREKLYGRIHTSRESYPLITKELLPPEIIAKRRFFVYVAKHVVFTGMSAGDVAKFFNINKTNVEIWASILLTHGQSAFFRKPMELSPQIESCILFEHNAHTSVSFTCARHGFVNQNRLKHILERRNSLPPCPLKHLNR